MERTSLAALGLAGSLGVGSLSGCMESLAYGFGGDPAAGRALDNLAEVIYTTESAKEAAKMGRSEVNVYTSGEDLNNSPRTYTIGIPNSMPKLITKYILERVSSPLFFARSEKNEINKTRKINNIIAKVQ